MKQKPLEVAHAPSIVNGKMYATLRVRTDVQERQTIGTLTIDEASWDDFKLLMEPVADFYLIVGNP